MPTLRTLALVLVFLAAPVAGFAFAHSIYSGDATRTITSNAEAGGGNMTVDELKLFGEFPVYWLGEEYQGLKLKQIRRHVFAPQPDSYARPENVIVFIYGDCVPPPDGGCAPPLSVRVEPACDSTLADLTREGAVDESSRRTTRGVESIEFEHQLRIYTTAVTVSVFSNDEKTIADAARDLVGANGERFSDADLTTAPGVDFPSAQTAC